LSLESLSSYKTYLQSIAFGKALRDFFQISLNIFRVMTFERLGVELGSGDSFARETVIRHITIRDRNALLQSLILLQILGIVLGLLLCSVTQYSPPHAIERKP
jgi:hypothetical protein